MIISQSSEREFALVGWSFLGHLLRLHYPHEAGSLAGFYSDDPRHPPGYTCDERHLRSSLPSSSAVERSRTNRQMGPISTLCESFHQSLRCTGRRVGKTMAGPLQQCRRAWSHRDAWPRETAQVRSCGEMAASFCIERAVVSPAAITLLLWIGPICIHVESRADDCLGNHHMQRRRRVVLHLRDDGTRFLRRQPLSKSSLKLHTRLVPRSVTLLTKSSPYINIFPGDCSWTASLFGFDG